MSSFGGGRSNRGGRGGRSGRGRSSGGRGRGGFQHGGGQPAPEGKLRPCSNFTTTGSCPRGNSCTFAHVVQIHANIDASSVIQDQNNSHHRGGYNQNQQKKAPISSAAIWQDKGAIKIFTGSHDGFWRLWNTQNNFVKEFEHNMGGGKVEVLEVASNFLFCGFEGVPVSLPNVKAGMIHAWNLESPNNPPLEFHMHPLAPYAHSSSVSCLKVVPESGNKVISASRDGVIRIWSYNVDKFVLNHTLYGHVGEVHGLVAVDSILWSAGSNDLTIRLWDLNKNGDCIHVISSTSQQQQPNAASPGGAAGGAGDGHTAAITDLVKFKSNDGNFVLSSSLDGNIKVWNGTNGQCMVTESHGAGVVCMAISEDPKGNHVLLIGLEWGDIMVRSLVPTANTPAFCLLFKLCTRYSAGHENGPVKTIRAGPSSTFYSGGDDGKLLVWQITGDLGL